MLECALSSAHLLLSGLFSAEDSGRYSYRFFSHKRGQHADFEMLGENHGRQSAHRHQRLELQSWRDGFYGDTPQKQWLRFCAKRFTGIEVNGTFYRLQEKTTYAKWRDETPEGFPFAIKGHRYVTHNKKLLDIEEPVIRCRESASPLGNRLAAVVWQLPAFLRKDSVRLEKFVKTLRHWKSTRHAIEFRHKSWFDDEVAECLKRHRVTVCISDAPDWPMWQEVTTDLVYARLHGHTRKYASSYSKAALRKWATRIQTWLKENRDVHVYFDNDAEGAAPRNALTLLEMLR